MIVLNYSDFRKNLKENLDKIWDDAETVIVSRAHNKNVVVVSLDEYNSWQETKYLMSTPNNQKRLLDAIKDTDEGDFVTHSLIEG